METFERYLKVEKQMFQMAICCNSSDIKEGSVDSLHGIEDVNLVMTARYIYFYIKIKSASD